MKKKLALLAALGLMVCMSACGKSGTGETTAAAKSETAAAAEAAKEQPKAQDQASAGSKGEIAYFCRVLGDFGFNDNGWLGCQNAAAKYGYKANVIELGNDTATFENAFLDACDSGKYDVIVTQNGSGLGDFVRKYAQDFPDTKFIVFDMGITEDAVLPENAHGIAYRACDGTFLAGALAAKMSGNKKIGILSSDNPGGNDFAAGYVSGAKYADPDCEVFYYYGGSDAAQWQEQASTMYEIGCNVVLACSGRFALGIFNEAYNRGGIDKGYLAMGIDTDMYYTLSKSETVELADVILSSATKELAYTIESAFDKMEEGSLEWGQKLIYGINEGGTSLCRNDYYKKIVPEEVQAYMDTLVGDMKSGKVKASSFYDFTGQEEFLSWIQPQLGK